MSSKPEDISKYLRENDIGTLIISIDGNISAGKTTIGTMLKGLAELKVKFLVEDGHEAEILEEWMKNPQKLAGLFQQHMYSLCWGRMKAAKVHKKYKTHDLVFVDRGMSGNAVFATTSKVYKKGIKPVEFAFYKKVYDVYTPSTFGGYDMAIYLWVKADTCWQRCGRRGYESEKENYVPEYYMELETMGFLAVLSNLSQETPNPFIMVDWNDETLQMDRMYDLLYSYLTSGVACPARIELSYEVCSEPHKYSAIFDYSAVKSERDFFTYENLAPVYDAISYRDGEINPTRVYIQAPAALSKQPFGGPFNLNL